MYIYIYIYVSIYKDICIYIYVHIYIFAYIPYLPKPLSHLLVSMKITTQTCSKMNVRMMISRNFTP